MADSNGFSRDGRDLGARPRDNQGQRRGDRRQTGRSGDGRRRDYRNSGNVRQRGRDQTHRDDQRGRYPQRQRNNQFINARDLSDHRQNRGGNNGRGGPPDMVYTGVGGRQQRAHGRPVVSQED